MAEDVTKLATGRLLDGLDRHPFDPGGELPSAGPHRLARGFVALAATLLRCGVGEPGPGFGERDALAALDELQRRVQEVAAREFPASTRTPLVQGLDGRRAAARAAVVASRRGP